jgi:8-oxo-dGTP pyrophosphatase MutT (NUDIX family)
MEIQYRMAPSKRIQTAWSQRDHQDAGVLILLYPSGSKINTVFIKRTDYPGIHSGQISFPGGKSEQDDKNICLTAIREAEEELGLDLQQIHVIGLLTRLHIPVSNITVYPVIGYIDSKPSFHHDRTEVDYVIETDLDELIKPGSMKYTFMEILSENVRVPYYDVSGNRIWGATAMILSEFIEILTRCRRMNQE